MQAHAGYAFRVLGACCWGFIRLLVHLMLPDAAWGLHELDMSCCNVLGVSPEVQQEPEACLPGQPAAGRCMCSGCSWQITAQPAASAHELCIHPFPCSS